MSKLLKSRKFLLVVLDAGVAIGTVIVTQFLSPEWQQFTIAIVVPVTAVITAAIVGIALEDSAALKAGTHPNQRNG